MTPSSNDGYAGQQGLSDPASKFNVLSFIMEQILGRASTVKLVQVKAVTNTGGVSPVGFVDIHPLVNQVDGLGNSTKHGTIFKVPYFRLQGGGNAVIIDPKVDDIGIAVIADRDISSVKETKAEANPGSKRRFDMADALYLGGLLNNTPDQYVQFNDTGIHIVDKNGNSVVTSSSGVQIVDKTGNTVVMSSTGIKLTDTAGIIVELKTGGTFVTGNLVVNGNLQLSGSIEDVGGATYSGDLKVGGNVIAGFGTGDQVGLQTHTHTQPNDSHGDTEQPTASPTAGT